MVTYIISDFADLAQQQNAIMPISTVYMLYVYIGHLDVTEIKGVFIVWVTFTAHADEVVVL